MICKAKKIKKNHVPILIAPNLEKNKGKKIKVVSNAFFLVQAGF